MLYKTKVSKNLAAGTYLIAKYIFRELKIMCTLQHIRQFVITRFNLGLTWVQESLGHLKKDRESFSISLSKVNRYCGIESREINYGSARDIHANDLSRTFSKRYKVQLLVNSKR